MRLWESFFLLLVCYTSLVRTEEQIVYVNNNNVDANHIILECKGQEAPDECRFHRPDGVRVCNDDDEGETNVFFFGEADKDNEPCIDDPDIYIMPLSSTCVAKILRFDPDRHLGQWQCSALVWGEPSLTLISLRSMSALNNVANVEFVDVWGDVTLRTNVDKEFACAVFSEQSEMRSEPQSQLVWTLGDVVSQRSSQYRLGQLYLGPNRWVQKFQLHSDLSHEGQRLKCALQNTDKADQITLRVVHVEEKQQENFRLVRGEVGVISKQLEVFPEVKEAVWEIKMADNKKEENIVYIEAGETTSNFRSSRLMVDDDSFVNGQKNIGKGMKIELNIDAVPPQLQEIALRLRIRDESILLPVSMTLESPSSLSSSVTTTPATTATTSMTTTSLSSSLLLAALLALVILLCCFFFICRLLCVSKDDVEPTQDVEANEELMAKTNNDEHKVSNDKKVFVEIALDEVDRSVDEHEAIHKLITRLEDKLEDKHDNDELNKKENEANNHTEKEQNDDWEKKNDNHDHHNQDHGTSVEDGQRASEPPLKDLGSKQLSSDSEGSRAYFDNNSELRSPSLVKEAQKMDETHEETPKEWRTNPIYETEGSSKSDRNGTNEGNKIEVNHSRLLEQVDRILEEVRSLGSPHHSELNISKE